MQGARFPVGDIRVLHVVSGLIAGGAENMLLRLSSGHAAGAATHHKVFALRDGPMRDRFVAAGVDVHIRPVSSLASFMGAMLALRRLILSWNPHVIQGWMYHGNLAATLAAGYSNRARIVWNIRQTLYDIAREKGATARVIKLNAALSRWPRRVVYNSSLSRKQHEEFGFSSTNAMYIANGVDTDVMSPVPARRKSLREEAGLSSAFVVGMAARCHPMKSHDVFLRAVAACTNDIPNIAIVLAGRGVEGDPVVAATVEKSGLASRIRYLGELREMSGFYDLLDVCCLSSSWGEGFPNVLAEAMAFGVPCVATRVGDSAMVIGEGGFCVDIGAEQEMATRIIEIARMSTESREALSAAARARVVDRFDIRTIAADYQRLYEDIGEQSESGG